MDPAGIEPTLIGLRGRHLTIQSRIHISNRLGRKTLCPLARTSSIYGNGTPNSNQYIGAPLRIWCARWGLNPRYTASKTVDSTIGLLAPFIGLLGQYFIVVVPTGVEPMSHAHQARALPIELRN